VKYNQTPLGGAFTIDPEPIRDSRGFFSRTFCSRESEPHGIETRIVQANHSLTIGKGTVRGLHMQLAPHQETKLVKCVSGSVFDVIVDVRPDSPTFLRWFGAELSSENLRMMYVPRGFAHGFQTLTEHAEILYLVSEFYSKDHERTLRFDDPAVGIVWPETPGNVSPKDLAAAALPPDFRGFA
jgi:dTDP-4-dehydrorhamnose 3,5-epimerase